MVKLDDVPDAKDVKQDPSGSVMGVVLLASAAGVAYAAATSGVNYIGKPIVNGTGNLAAGISNLAEDTSTDSTIDSEDIF